MGNTWQRTLPAPVGGAFQDAAANPRGVPPQGATLLQNFLLRAGYVRSRYGTVQLADVPDTKPVIDLFNVAFGTGAVEVIRHDRTQSYRFNGTTWAAMTGATWTGDDTRRFWTVLAPFGVDSKGRILMNNGIDAIRTWNGSVVADMGANAVPARYAITGDEGRLFMGDTLEAGERRAQRVRWTTIALAEGDHTAWSAVGSGAIDLRGDSWRVTGFWKQAGRIFVGKERSIVLLAPTGLATDAYGYETVVTNGEGVFAPHSINQFGEIVTFMSHRTINIFVGGSPRDILGDRNRETLFRRLNYSALDQVTGVVDAENNRVGWGLPLDGASFPTEIWWYDIQRDAWEMDSFAHTALSLFTGVDVTTIDELGGDIQSLGGTSIDNLTATSTPKGSIIAGKSNGQVQQFDGAALTDTGSGITASYISPALFPLDDLVTIAAKEHKVSESDYFVANEVAITFLDFGHTYSVMVGVSGDGVTFSDLGTITVTTTGGTVAAPKIVRKKITGRVGLEKQIQVKFVNATTGVLWGFADFTVKADISGRKI